MPDETKYSATIKASPAIHLMIEPLGTADRQSRLPIQTSLLIYWHDSAAVTAGLVLKYVTL
jgi:hypothetical protein